MEDKQSKAANGRERTDPVADDPTYGALRESNRVVMRHNIALNLESFRATADDFDPRPQISHPELRPVHSPFFSVLVPTYNGMTYLPTVMEALAKQDFNDFEVLVLDDASTDDTVSWVESMYPQARLVVNRTNQGFVATCNAGADVARGRFIVLLNNDAEPEPTWLSAMAHAICTNPDASMFASKILLFDERSRLHSAGDMMGIDGVPRNRGVWEVDHGQFDAERQVFGCCGGGAVYRRELWQALGGFDEKFWMYLEDVDFSFRAQLLGERCVFVPEARVYHHLSGTGGGVLASYFVGRNTLWTIAKNMPRNLLVRNLPKIVAAQIRIAIDALCNIRGEAARARLRGQVAGLRVIMPILVKRRFVQSRRRATDAELLRKLQ